MTVLLDDAIHYTTSDILYNYSDEKSLKNTEVEVRRQRFKPSLPNRSKSAPLPSDDEDSSEGRLAFVITGLLGMDTH